MCDIACLFHRGYSHLSLMSILGGAKCCKAYKVITSAHPPDCVWSSNSKLELLFSMPPLTLLAGLLAFSALGAARKPTLKERQIPQDPEGVMTITSPQGASIRFKQPGKQGVCETAEGADDYSGYISLDEKTNMFFWFFEARENPSEKPVSRPAMCKKGWS
jgi:hypothetical protein